MNDVVALILICLSIVLLIVSVTWTMIMIRNYIALQKQFKNLEKTNAELEKENQLQNINYSDELLKYIRTFTAQVTLIKFRTFIDTHQLEKVTKANIEKLIAEIATIVKQSINADNIIFDDTLFTREFYETYIVETTIVTVKDLLNKSVTDVVE